VQDEFAALNAQVSIPALPRPPRSALHLGHPRTHPFLIPHYPPPSPYPTESTAQQVIAASCDSQFSHLAWTNTPRSEGGLGDMKIPIVADFTKKVTAWPRASPRLVSSHSFPSPLPRLSLASLSPLSRLSLASLPPATSSVCVCPALGPFCSRRSIRAPFCLLCYRHPHASCPVPAPRPLRSLARWRRRTACCCLTACPSAPSSSSTPKVRALWVYILYHRAPFLPLLFPTDPLAFLPPLFCSHLAP